MRGTSLAPTAAECVAERERPDSVPRTPCVPHSPESTHHPFADITADETCTTQVVPRSRCADRFVPPDTRVLTVNDALTTSVTTSRSVGNPRYTEAQMRSLPPKARCSFAAKVTEQRRERL